jgi:Tfp pilus assembly protein PilF/SAM-dependent methyltransferase
VSDEQQLLDRLGEALQAHAQNDLARAGALCAEVLAEAPTRPEALTLKGILLRKEERLDEAEACYRQALEAAPHYPDAHHNLGNLELARGRTEAGLEHFRRALALRPDWAEGENRVAAALHALGRFDEAFSHFQRALALAPDHADIHWDHALALLAAGRYPEGWREYEWRWARRQPAPRDFAQPLWQGGDLAGKRILVYVEQGYGDAIQFLRFLPLIKARGGHVILELHEILQPLVDAVLGADQVVTMGGPLPEFDTHISLLSVPAVLAIALDALPAAVPYLRVRPERLAHWRPRLAGPGLKVAVVWAGNPNVKNDRWRSPRLAPLLPLLDTPGVRFFAVQKGDGSNDLAAAGPLPALTDLGPDLRDFGDTAAILLEMDLVITTDTSVAHLAGALARPTWLMLHAEPDWRWLRDRADSPWYPTARLYRQDTLGDWSGVVAALGRDLRRLAGIAEPALRQPFPACPLCGSQDETRLATYDCRGHKLWHPPLPATLAWMRCRQCGHVHTDGYYTEAGLAALFEKSHAGQVAGGDHDGQRFVWSRVVERVLAHLPDPGRLFDGDLSWLDVGCGNGGLVLTAAEYGFAATGLDARRETAERLAALGAQALVGDLMTVALADRYSVISLADVLEHLPDPRAALARVRAHLADDGLLFVSCPNLDCASWRAMDAEAGNPYWIEIEHLHNFSRARLVALLRECGFEPVAYGVSQRYKACMEIIARPGPGIVENLT